MLYQISWTNTEGMNALMPLTGVTSEYADSEQEAKLAFAKKYPYNTIKGIKEIPQQEGNSELGNLMAGGFLPHNFFNK